MPSPVECSFNLPFNSTFVSGVEFLITHTPDPNQEAGQGLEAGAWKSLLELEVGLGSLQFQLNMQAKRDSDSKTMQHTYTGKGKFSLFLPSPHTHTHRETGQLNLVGLPNPQTDPVERAPNALSLAH